MLIHSPTIVPVDIIPSGVQGQIIFDKHDGYLKYHNGFGWTKTNSTGGGQVIGQVFLYSGKDNPTGALKLNGSIIESCNERYPQFYEWLVANAPTIALADYELDSSGQCAVYGLDEETGTVQLPTVYYAVGGNADAVGTIATTPTSVYGVTTVSGEIPSSAVYTWCVQVEANNLLNVPYNIFDYKWTDKLLNNASWLRATGQSASGEIYSGAYKHLVSEYNGSGQTGSETVGSSTVAYRVGATTGMKIITDIAVYDAVLSETGAVPYYLLDEENVEFRVPYVSGITVQPLDEYLYFYVGNVNQYDSLIDMGKVLERLTALEELVASLQNAG